MATPKNSSNTSKYTFWSSDKIVAFGLVVMGIIAVTGDITYKIMLGGTTGSEVPMAIVSGLTGFLGRGLLNSNELKNEVNNAVNDRQKDFEKMVDAKIEEYDQTPDDPTDDIVPTVVTKKEEIK